MVLKYKCMRNVTGTYILSLAVADLLVIVTSVPFIATGYTLEYWPWGTAVCKLSQIMKDIFTVVSVFTLTVLSAERYSATINPLRKFQMARFQSIRVTIFIWTLACILAVPSAVFSDVHHLELNYKNSSICTPFPAVPHLKSYMQVCAVVKALTYYILPLCTITAFYLLMTRKLKTSAQELVEVFHGAQKVAEVRLRVAGVLLVFVIVFFLCFLPYQIFGLWFYFQSTSFDDYIDFRKAMRITGFCLNFLNACINPIALYCLSGVFRQHNRMKCLCAETCCLLLIYFQLCAVSKLNETF